MLHADKQSIVNQREIGTDTDDSPRALQAGAAPGPRRHPHRRDARPRDGVGRARRRPRPVTSSSRRCTRSTRPRRSTGSSTSSRRSSSSRCACRWPASLRGIVSQRLLERADGSGPGARRRGARVDGPGVRQDRRPRRRRTRSRRSSPTASTTGCRRSTRACSPCTRTAWSTLRDALAVVLPSPRLPPQAAAGRPGHHVLGGR